MTTDEQAVKLIHDILSALQPIKDLSAEMEKDIIKGHTG